MEMHFFKNSVSFIAVMCVFGVACAATTGRVGVVSTSGAMRRLPSLSNVIKATSGGTVATATTTSSSTGTSLLSDTDCIDNYRDCMKSENACGSDFEECTTNVLFHGHMSECFSTLYQCSPNAIDKLLGTSNLSALSNVDSYVSDTNNAEVARYTYPTDGSIMGIDIIGAATRNKLSTADCVKKYKRCLNKDNVCGEDFELCTSDEEFKKQAAMCDSTLARCQKEGFQQLFGEAITTKPAHKKLKPNADGDAHKWIEEGAALAAANAVNTCYKVVDTCFANACAKNPYSCVEDVDWSVVNSAQSIVETGIDIDNIDTTRTGKQMATDVRKFFRAACTDTIGANQYCYMTFNDGKKPTKKDLQDEDLREDVFGEAYASRRTILTNKVNELVKKFDTTARNKCIETFKSCAVHSCGGGSGAACYSRVFSGNNQKTINTENNNVYSDIENGCAAVVNTDANCRHMAAMQGADTYTYEMGGTTDSFGILFPKYDGSNSMLPIVAALNADLSTSYNDAAIEQMKKQCQNVVENCVKSMCGKDFKNCYRNRNDVSLTVYNSGNDKFDKSMNKVGGVLDYAIVQGLCSSTIRNADACAESLAIAKVGLSDGSADVTAGWGNSGNITTLNNAWRNSASAATSDGLVQEVDSNGNKICDCKDGGTAVCGYESGGNVNCQTPHRVSKSTLLESQAVATLFQDILGLVEQEAQAKYNAKLTKEQNICLSQNTGANPNPTFVWAKLTGSKKVPSDYSSNGLGTKTTVDSNDLYGSFCRVKVTLQSEDRDVQTRIAGSENAYFATGDSFTCGSWLSQDALDNITKKIGEDARKEAGEGSQKDFNTKLWTTLGVGTVGGIGSFIGMNALQTNGSSLGGLLKTNTTSNKKKDVTEAQKKAAEECVDLIDGKDSEIGAMALVDTVRYMEASDANAQTAMQTAQRKAEDARAKALAAGVDKASSMSFADNRTKTQTNDSYSWTNQSGARTAAAALKASALTQFGGDVNTGCVNITDTTIKTNCNTALGYIGNLQTWANSSNPQSYLSSAQNAVTGLAGLGLTYNLDGYYTHDTNAQQVWSDTKLFDKYKTNLNTLRSECLAVKDSYESDSDRKSRMTKNLIAGGVGALATGALANGIVSTVQKAKYESAENEAVKKWMESIGSKIHCYVGGQMVGDFGDIVSIDIDED